MALNVTSSYAGKGAIDFIAPSLLSATSIQNGYVTVLTNIKYKYALVIANNSDDLIQAENANCNFDPQGTITLSERSLTPAHMKVNFEACKTKLETQWSAELMKAGQLNSTLTPNFIDFLMKRLEEYVSSNLEILMWQGAVASTSGKVYLNAVDGFVTLAKADAATVKVTGTTVTSANAVTEIGKVYAAIPDTIFDKEDLKIYVSRATYRNYALNLQANYQANSSVPSVQMNLGDLSYQGIPVVMVGIANNTIIAARASNLFLGLDLTSDTQEIKIIDLSETTGDDIIRAKMRFELSVNFGTPELVIYS